MASVASIDPTEPVHLRWDSYPLYLDDDVSIMIADSQKSGRRVTLNYEDQERKYIFSRISGKT